MISDEEWVKIVEKFEQQKRLSTTPHASYYLYHAIMPPVNKPLQIYIPLNDHGYSIFGLHCTANFDYDGTIIFQSHHRNAVSLVHTVHARETASDLIQATRFSDDSVVRRYRQILQEYLDKSDSESVPGQTGRPVSD